MSVLISSDDLNDFVNPGFACIKPVETLPAQPENAYEVTTEDKVAAAAPAKITLSDCLACSGCVTSAETVLMSMQSHAEVLNALDSAPSAPSASLRQAAACGQLKGDNQLPPDSKVFVASLSPQVRASLATTYGVSERRAGQMVEQLLCGSGGVAAGGQHGSRFAWVVDTNAMREVCLVEEAAEAARARDAGDRGRKRPLITSACPGWVCVVEKKHPPVIPHLSPLKSPQALTGTLLKSVLSAVLGLHPSRIWHLAIMPCFDKKLEAARLELTDERWVSTPSDSASEPVRDVDCVITTRELLSIADARGISFSDLPQAPLASRDRVPFPDPEIRTFILPKTHRGNGTATQPGAGTSGGFLQHVLASQVALHPGSVIRSHTGLSRRGRKADETVYEVCLPSSASPPSPDSQTGCAAASTEDRVIFRGKRAYGFRNIKNLLNKIDPARRTKSSAGTTFDCDYVEVMACPGGCTNGGGQIKLEGLDELQVKSKESTDRTWLQYVDEAYFSMSDDEFEGLDDSDPDESAVRGDNAVKELEVGDEVGGISPSRISQFVRKWEGVTGISREKLLYTTFKEVESDVGKPGATKEETAALLNKSGWQL